MIQSWVEIEHYSVTTLLRSKRYSAKLPLREELIDLSDIYAPTLCIGAAPFTEVLCYSTLNSITRSKYTFDSYQGVSHIFHLSGHGLVSQISKGTLHQK